VPWRRPHRRPRPGRGQFVDAAAVVDSAATVAPIAATGRASARIFLARAPTAPNCPPPPPAPGHRLGRRSGRVL